MTSEPRLKLAVFIDFDNIEIGVKSTLGGQFDVGSVLEALKERGEVVSKTAYGDWKRAGDHSRLLTQHAIKMVQRNVTPGGDKNGADINLALDALEMAFTHDHINAFVIVGGDSDFISLVEKLKQYDKKVFVVGGRAFTSIILQRNCTEFIAYENLVGVPARRPVGRDRPAAPQGGGINQVFPLVQRALKVLADREVSPQLGLLKSTLLQLDSTFSERSYGATSFRDFAEKLAAGGLVHLKHTGRNVLVELREDAETTAAPSGDGSAARPEPTPIPAAENVPVPAPVQGGTMGPGDGIAEIRRIFQASTLTPRWPMYLRNVKQIVRSVDPTFDERRYGFSSLVDLLRACGREGLFRLERDRQGVMRVFPGGSLGAAIPEISKEPPSALGSAAEAELAGEETGTSPEPAMSAEPEPVAAHRPSGSRFVRVTDTEPPPVGAQVAAATTQSPVAAEPEEESDASPAAMRDATGDATEEAPQPEATEGAVASPDVQPPARAAKTARRRRTASVKSEKKTAAARPATRAATRTRTRRTQETKAKV